MILSPRRNSPSASPSSDSARARTAAASRIVAATSASSRHDSAPTRRRHSVRGARGLMTTAARTRGRSDHGRAAATSSRNAAGTARRRTETSTCSSSGLARAPRARRRAARRRATPPRTARPRRPRRARPRTSRRCYRLGPAPKRRACTSARATSRLTRPRPVTAPRAKPLSSSVLAAGHGCSSQFDSHSDVHGATARTSPTSSELRIERRADKAGAASPGVSGSRRAAGRAPRRRGSSSPARRAR